VAQSQAQTTPQWFRITPSVPPTIHRGFLVPFWPICAGLRPSRMGWINAIPELSATPNTVGAARKRAVHAVGVAKSRAKRVRSGMCGHNGRSSRGSHRENARIPPPLMANSKARGTTSLGYSVASGRFGTSSLSWSTAENSAIIKSWVVITCAPLR
jgi:hypothetical protein